MSQLATLHIDKQAHKFSAAHFTIFSQTERERLHGHNYGVSARIVAEMGENGFSADYNVYKRCLQKLCDAHDEYMLLPANRRGWPLKNSKANISPPLMVKPCASRWTRRYCCPSST